MIKRLCVLIIVLVICLQVTTAEDLTATIILNSPILPSPTQRGISLVIMIQRQSATNG